MIKDHLGNVRIVITEEVKEDIYPTLSFEGASGSPEVANQAAIWEDDSALFRGTRNNRISYFQKCTFK